MEWQDVLSILGGYVSAIILLVAVHVMSYGFEGQLYDHNKYNESRKTLKIRHRWLFWRCEKTDNKEIFTMVFVHELINIILFIIMTALLVLSLILNNELIVLSGCIPAFIYFCYIIIAQKHFLKKYK